MIHRPRADRQWRVVFPGELVEVAPGGVDGWPIPIREVLRSFERGLTWDDGSRNLTTHNRMNARWARLDAAILRVTETDAAAFVA